MSFFFSVFPDGCRCKGHTSPFTIRAKPGEQTALVTWPEPEVTCTEYIRKEVNPPRTSPSNFSLGPHKITYSFWYKGYKQDLKCFINFTVGTRVPKTIF